MTRMEILPKILVFSDYYLPGYKSGGGMRTIVNIVDRLGDRFKFYVVTRDHDGKLDREPYTGVKINQWNKVGNAEVYYFSKDQMGFKLFRKLIDYVSPDGFYLNSFFATPALILLLLRKFKAIEEKPVILAPCGELSKGALGFKSLKKKIFISAARAIGLHGGVTWKASSETEQEDIRKFVSENAPIYISPDLPPKSYGEAFKIESKPRKNPGELKLVFLSRFAPSKNFGAVIDFLSNVDGEVLVDILGAKENQAYWAECEERIRKLPSNIRIEYKGTVPNHEVVSRLLDYHFFILPTFGENFGHVIIEAMAAGCPLLISDQTPWLGLEKEGIGWDIPLKDRERWIDRLGYCVEMGDEEYRRLSLRANGFIANWLNDPLLDQKTLEILNVLV